MNVWTTGTRVAGDTALPISPFLTLLARGQDGILAGLGSVRYMIKSDVTFSIF